MKNYSTSNQLIRNTKDFLKISYYSFFHRLFSKKGVFCGWGRKRSGLEAIELAKKLDTSYKLLEDGFIRSYGLGVEGSPSFSLIEDDLGIYYDAIAPSKLEEILNSYDFTANEVLMEDAQRAIELIKKYCISKYNNASLEISNLVEDNDSRVLIIAQTEGDASLEYGMLDQFTTGDMITAAIEENPEAVIYLKIHPDVISGKKKSDINILNLDARVHVITENVNPISLLKYFDKVYTKTSQMGFEALLVGCDCVCFGMPFYAGWGITIDKSICDRRNRKLSVEEVFAGAYILYTQYFNPYTKKHSDIFDTIQSIIMLREKFE